MNLCLTLNFRIVRHALNGLKNGFFVECGALDGEIRSNTLFLEKKLGWKVRDFEF